LPIASLLATNPILQGITATSPKPSFLLWEKAQRRAASAEEEVWLLRGLQAFVGRFDDKLAKDEALRYVKHVTSPLRLIITRQR
jgi:hypothetical protein